MSIITTIVLAVLGSSGLSAVVVACLQHHWSKKETADARIDALVEANQVMIVDRIRFLGRSYIKQGSIRLEDKENIVAMYNAYKGLGGNGHLNTIMDEISRLEVKG